MAAIERNSGAKRQDLLVQSKKIVDLVLQVPHHSRDTGRVLDAVGLVKADLHVLERHQNLMRQLSTGITTEDVDNTLQHIRKAAALRPIDDAATEQRIIVLAGLQHIRMATEFNERVAQRPQDGIAIFQAGISSESVQQAIVHVNEAKQLIEEAPRKVKEPEPEVEESLLATEPTQLDTVANDTPVKETKAEPEPPVFLPPDDFVSMQAGANATAEKPKEPPIIVQKVQSITRRSRGLSRRSLINRGGLVLGGLVTAGQLTGVAPVAKWVAEAFDIRPKTPEQEEVYMQKYSLSEKPTKPSDGGWEITYPTIEKDEEFTDLFNGNFRQLNTGFFETEIYMPLGENNPFKAATADIIFEVFEDKFQGPLAAVKYRGRGGNDGGFGWYLLSGRKAPDNPEQRQSPHVIQLRNVNTKATFYLEANLTKVAEENRIEIRYMKKAKKAILNP